MSVFKFAEFEKFYTEFNPLTPYGKKEKNEKKIYNCSKFLDKEFTYIEYFIKFIFKDKNLISAIEYHLKRIPELNFLNNDFYSAADIFQIKKFLYNYKNISDKLPEEIFILFFSKFMPTSLFKKLNLNDNKETFYLSEKLSEKLAEIRNEIKKFDNKILEVKRNRINEIKENFSLDFRFQDFIVMDEDKVLKLSDSHIYKESYDNSKVVLKPIYPEKYFNLHNQKEKLVNAEKEEEKNVLISLTKRIKKELKHLNTYIKSIHKFDIILAKSVLAKKYKMIKPVLQKYGSQITIKNGFNIPVSNYCENLETKYFPLNALFKDRIIVISGSNMGGKTVVLKTISFLQLLTQMGFYVPAEEFKTIVFDDINYIGELKHNTSAGLSSYGIEIFSFIKATNKSDCKSLLIIDEFAGTTNSKEAEALISAILSDFSKKYNTYAFLSTHFMNLPEVQNLSYYRMKGLDSKKYEKYYKSKSSYSFEERIKLINSFMRYEIEPDNKIQSSFDALKVAEILGLDQNIIDRANQILNNS